MRYLTIGYYAICLGPLLSAFFYFNASSLGITDRSYLGVQFLVISVQVCGIILYLLGYRKTEILSEKSPHILGVAILLILWGLLIAWYSIISYNFHVERYLPEKPLTFWDNMIYRTLR